MEDLPENSYETKMFLHENEKLDSKLLKKSYVVTFICEDDNNFKIKASDDDVNYLFHFRYTDYVNMKEKDFIYKVNNFKLLLETVEIAINKNRVTLCNIGEGLKLTFYYTNIYEEKEISFELHEQLTDEEEKKLIGIFYAESEAIYETNDIDYRAEIVNYNKYFEDYGDRKIIRATIKNIGTTTWKKGIASLQCVPEFSSLLCKEYFFEEDVIPGDEVEITLEFLEDEENFEPPYFTFMHLHVLLQNYEPMLVFDFNNSFLNKKTELECPDIRLKEEEKDNKNNSMTDNKINTKNDDDNNNKINFINDNDNNNKINFINDDDNSHKINSKNDDDNSNKNNNKNDDDNNNKINFINDDDNSHKINSKNDEDNKSKNNIKKDVKKTDKKEINELKKIEKKEIKKNDSCPKKNLFTK